MPKKRADGRYEVKVRISKPGEPRKYKAVYGTTLKEARQKAEEIKSAIDQTNRVQKYTVADAIDYYLDQKAKVIRPQSLKFVKGALRYAMDAQAGRELTEITVDDARQLYDAVAQHSLSQANCLSQNMRQLYKDEARAHRSGACGCVFRQTRPLVDGIYIGTPLYWDAAR